MPIRVYYEVLNQKGTPALYSDNYAQRPAAGYQGRIFYSPDTAQIFYDTGSTWTLLADAGVGSGSLASVCANGNTTATGITITGGGLNTDALTIASITQGSIVFAGIGGAFTQNSTKFFWDNTNFRLGIGTNTPSTTLDIHGTTGVLVQINNTTTADSKIAFLNADVAKWRIGNLYNGGLNDFHVYNNTTATIPFKIDNTNYIYFNGTNTYISPQGNILTSGSIAVAERTLGIYTTTGGYTTFNANVNGATNYVTIVYGTGNYNQLQFSNAANYTYTFPSATGTLALTSNLSSYLPLAGGTMTGGLTINSTLYINPTNTSLTGLDVASDSISFRSDNLEGSKRQLLLTMGSGTLIQFTAQGYGAARGTDVAYYTSSASGVNATPIIYMTGGNNIGVNTGNPFASVAYLQGINIYSPSNNGALRVNSSSYTGVDLVQQTDGKAFLYLRDNAIFTFGQNATEAFRITTQNNLHVNGEIGANIPLCVIGKDSTSSNFAFRANNSVGTTLLTIRNDGNVGINTTTPQSKFFVNLATNQNVRFSSETNTSVQAVNDAASAFVNFKLDGLNLYLNSQSGGYVTINGLSAVNVAAGRGNLNVTGSSSAIINFVQTTTELGYIYHSGSNISLVNSVAGGQLQCVNVSAGVYLSQGATSWTAISDQRLKNITGNIENALDSLMTLRTIKHTWINNNDDKEYFGLIAQDVNNVFPQVIDKNKLFTKASDEEIDNTEYLGVRYTELIPVIIKGIQELNNKIENLN